MSGAISRGVTGWGLACCCCSVLSCAQLFATPWTAARQVSPSFTISQSLLKLMSVESMMPFNHLILCCPLLLLPSVFLSIRIFSSESALCINGQSFSLGRGKIQEIDDSESYTTTSMYLVPLNCTVKYGKSSMFHIVYEIKLKKF